jgi:hypothetical protein
MLRRRNYRRVSCHLVFGRLKTHYCSGTSKGAFQSALQQDLWKVCWLYMNIYKLPCKNFILLLISKAKCRFILQNSRKLSNTVYFDVSLTVHLSITLANDQIDAQIFSTFITILYVYMFRTISCSSSGGQIVLIQYLVSSLSVSDRPVHRTVTY